MSWIIFWGITLVIVLIAYAGLFVWVTLGGMSDIRSMLTALQQQGQESNDDPF
ncbi:MAG: hypothetical protein P1V35_06870 [Planctomycetota bacterium]|nr:hypothetical protein [Sulfitobacter sp.]MDF1837569.1 hypothetical protein [Planctomycetota bacterium]